MAIRDPFDNVQYRFFFLADYEEDKSAVVMKVHHIFGDGLAISSFMLHLFGEYDVTNLPSLRPMSIFKRMMLTLLFPYLCLVGTIKNVLIATDDNYLKRDEPMTGRKNGWYVELDL